MTLPPGLEGEGFIPRPSTGFQAKAEDITPSEITLEMRPKGTLRPEIRQLSENSGAYIIVSSRSSASNTALKNRLKAMAEAVRDVPGGDRLVLDFYDRRRVETWLRDHAGTSLWARERIGKPMQGWQSYGDWSKVPKGVDAKFLLDDQLRVKGQIEVAQAGLTVVAGINLMRSRLREPGGVVRLVGLSGTGKTRFVQALFDPEVGENSLDPDLAAYTDLADSPNPQPPAVASEQIASRKRTILVVDNCPPDLHRQLTAPCRTTNSLLSLVTIEYDIQDDLPEGTDVFILGDASTDLIEKLLRQRFVNLSAVNSRRIADFSGGNSRIAIALASTVDENETVGGLSDSELFKRLFQQRQGSDDALFVAAQVLSLVYSFRGEDVTRSEEDELSHLGSLVGKSAKEMFKHSAELQRRGLIQSRGPWRAVLPHAIANRLASTALENIPLTVLEGCFVGDGRDRLLKSFSRRLGYLHACKQARIIVSKWLSPGGILDRVSDLDDLGYSIFTNVAPVVPEKTLSTLERTLLTEGM